MSAGAGLIPIPWVDLTSIAGVQLKMLAALSKIYEVPFHKNLGKSAIASLVSFVLPHAIAFGTVGSIIKLVPFVGTLPGSVWQSAFAGAYTWALGNVFIQHFESGGTFLDFNAEKVKEHFQAQFKEGQKMAASMGQAEQKTESAQPKAD